MKTRFSSIVTYKYSKMQEDEVALQKALARLQNAKEELARSIAGLEELQTPQEGNIQNFLASRLLFDAQFRLIEKNKEWVAFEDSQVIAAREQLKQSMIEYEKFKYLEAEEIKKMQKMLASKESKRLDDLAIISYNQKEAI